MKVRHYERTVATASRERPPMTLGLTPAESQVAVSLADGKSVRNMATATGLTQGAIYWHLKQIYRKLPISRQVDLVRLVLSLVSTLTLWTID